MENFIFYLNIKLWMKCCNVISGNPISGIYIFFCLDRKIGLEWEISGLRKNVFSNAIEMTKTDLLIRPIEV